MHDEELQIGQVARLINLSRAHLHKLRAAGEFTPKGRGKRPTTYRASEIAAWHEERYERPLDISPAAIERAKKAAPR